MALTGEWLKTDRLQTTPCNFNPLTWWGMTTVNRTRCVQTQHYLQRHGGLCKKHSFMHTDTKSHPHTCNIPSSKVWLHIVTTVSLLRICPGIQACFQYYAGVLSSTHLFHFTEAKPLHHCFAASLNPLPLSDLSFPLLPLIVFFFFCSRKTSGLYVLLLLFHFYPVQLRSPLLHSVTKSASMWLQAVLCPWCIYHSVFVSLPAFVLLHLRHTIIYFLSSLSQS